MTRPAADAITLHVPFRIVKRGGRKAIALPDGVSAPRRPDDALVKALARAFRWKMMLESGEFSSISELADREGIAFTYMARLMRLTLLSPEIVASIMDGRQPADVSLANLINSFPLDWNEQRTRWPER